MGANDPVARRHSHSHQVGNHHNGIQRNDYSNQSKRQSKKYDNSNKEANQDKCNGKDDNMRITKTKSNTLLVSEDLYSINRITIDIMEKIIIEYCIEKDNNTRQFEKAENIIKKRIKK